jgi:hypothetical protein
VAGRWLRHEQTGVYFLFIFFLLCDRMRGRYGAAVAGRWLRRAQTGVRVKLVLAPKSAMRGRGERGICVCVCVFVYVCVYVCVYMYVYICIMYVYVYIFMCVCVCIYIYIYRCPAYGVRWWAIPSRGGWLINKRYHVLPAAIKGMFFCIKWVFFFFTETF